jgi:hypothetical protein
MLLFVVVGWLLGASAPMAVAAQNVANASQKGSLLIFPRIDTTVDSSIHAQRDTIIRISNDYPQDTRIKCYWVNRDQTIQDFEFTITSTQPIWFRASDGLGSGTYSAQSTTSNALNVPPFFENSVGELKCWAVNTAGTDQIAWNHLYGTAMVVDYLAQTAYEYNSFNFTVRPPGYAIGGSVPPQGDLKLSAKAQEYDACPMYLLFNFFVYDNTGFNQIGLSGEATAVTFERTNLTLVPCNQDLRQDRVPTCTKAKFDVWSENEVKFTGAYQCLKCYFEGYLSELSRPRGGFGGLKFTWLGLRTTVGRLRVQGIASTVCQNVFTTEGADGQPVDQCWNDPVDIQYRGQVATPLLGMITTEVTFSGHQTLIGATAFGAGTGAPAHILWDYADLPSENSIR